MTPSRKAHLARQDQPQRDWLLDTFGPVSLRLTLKTHLSYKGADVNSLPMQTQTKSKFKQAPFNEEAERFILSVVNTKKGHENLSEKSFADIVAYARKNGFKFTDIDLLGTLSHYYNNKFPLPYWLGSKLGALANWRGWQHP
jgi:hypothetical protein